MATCVRESSGPSTTPNAWRSSIRSATGFGSMSLWQRPRASPGPRQGEHERFVGPRLDGHLERRRRGLAVAAAQLVLARVGIFPLGVGADVVPQEGDGILAGVGAVVRAIRGQDERAVGRR